ncbi:hypothetical protein TNCV_1682921 [Trichonephila clavipes]|nr:hypothetical protein TNCV_1682921 [Trichonephila clavipes]
MGRQLQRPFENHPGDEKTAAERAGPIATRTALFQRSASLVDPTPTRPPRNRTPTTGRWKGDALNLLGTGGRDDSSSHKLLDSSNL